jgi:molybdopterin-guanine dinucleotide biosynthesis protein B
MAGIWIQIVGSRKTGKTVLLEAITRELVRRGRGVTYIKHAHAAPRLEPADTDTARLRAAGATAAILASGDATIVHRSSDGEPLERIALRESLPGEIVLAEGFKHAAGRKIVVAGGDLRIDALSEVIAVVGDAPEGFDGPTFGPENVAAICNLIEAAAAPSAEEAWTASLEVDGTGVPLNAFVQNMIGGTIRGMTSALEGAAEPSEIRISCRAGSGSLKESTE